MEVAKRAIPAMYSVLYTVHIRSERATLPLPLLLSPRDSLLHNVAIFFS